MGLFIYISDTTTIWSIMTIYRCIVLGTIHIVIFIILTLVCIMFHWYGVGYFSINVEFI